MYLPTQVAELDLETVTLTTEPCLPTPKFSRPAKIWPLYAVLLASLISCLFDAYFCRLRAVICDVFYPNRAYQRALFLYNKIRSGRKLRYLQLDLILSRKYGSKLRGREHSVWHKLLDTMCWGRKIKIFSYCLSCDKIMRASEIVIYEMDMRNKADLVTVQICSDCYMQE